MTTRPPATTSAASVVGFLVVLEFASGILQAWLPPLLPSILRQFSTTAAELNWVNAVYLLSTAVCVPLMAKLGDRYGHRRLLIIAACLVAAGWATTTVSLPPRSYRASDISTPSRRADPSAVTAANTASGGPAAAAIAVTRRRAACSLAM